MRIFRKRRALAWTAALAVAATPVAASAAGATCRPARLDGSGDVDLSAYRGQYVYVDFWASWCGACRASFPFMNGLGPKVAGTPLKILAISVDKKRDDALAFARKNPLAADLAFDPSGACAKQFGVKGMPSSFLLSPKGELVFAHSGFLPKDRIALRQKIEGALTRGK